MIEDWKFQRELARAVAIDLQTTMKMPTIGKAIDALQTKIDEDHELLAFVKSWAGEMSSGLPEDWKGRPGEEPSKPKDEFWRLYDRWLEKQQARGLFPRPKRDPGHCYRDPSVVGCCAGPDACSCECNVCQDPR